MANTTLYLNGTAKWAKLKTPDPKFDCWTLDFYPSEESFKLLKKAGAQNKTYIDKEDGHKPYVKLRRQAKKVIKDKLVTFEAPDVLTNDNAPFNGNVGNGSEVTCKITIFDSAKGKGTRLEAVRIEKLVEYKGTDTVVIGEPTLPF